MNDVSILRTVDEAGRIVIPIEVRNLLGLVSGSRMELLVEGDTILLRLCKEG